jgi:hypothetical protein
MMNMMRRKNPIFLFVWIMFLMIIIVDAADKIQLKIEKKWEIGKRDLMFASIASVCEDPESNLFVLDRMEHKVLKFSPEGKLIQTFGQKGQGPGDYQNPHLLTFTPKGQLVVADEMYNLTFLNDEGHFIERVHLDGRLAVSFIGEERFYGWIWGQDNRSQVMVDNKNNILKSFFQVPLSTFSVSAPDESGRLVMFNYSREEFAPSLQFAHFGRFSAIGIGDRYDILILDENGDTINHLQREVPADRITKTEKTFFEKDIERLGKERGWPRNVIRNLVKKIPDKKIFFDQILMTEEHVFVFRIKSDITEETGPYPVDIFSVKGEFLGTMHVPDKPLYISQNNIYFVRSDERDNLFLEKTAYKVIRN